MKKIVSIACVAMPGSGLAQAGGQPTKAGQATPVQEGSAPAPAATSAFRLGPAAQAQQSAAAEENMRQAAISGSRSNDTGQRRLSIAGKPVFGNNLLAQNDDTARFVTVPEVYTATQARTCATVGVRPERKLR